MIRKFFSTLIILILISSSAILQAMEEVMPLTKEVKSLKELAGLFIVHQIKDHVQQLSGKDKTEVIDTITRRWLSPEKINRDCADYIKDTFCTQNRAQTAHENKVKVFDNWAEYLVYLNANKIFVGSEHGNICIWDYKTNNQVHNTSHSTRIISCKQLQNENIVVASRYVVNILDPNTGNCIKSIIENGWPQDVHCMNLLAHHQVAIGHYSTIKVFDTQGLRCIAQKDIHNHFIENIKQLSDGRIATGAMDRIIKIWDNNNFDNCLSLTGHSGKIDHLEELSNGNIITDGHDNTVRIWNSKTGQCLFEITLSEERSILLDIEDFFPISESIFAVNACKSIFIIDTNSGTIRYTLKNKDYIRIARISDNYLACAENSTITIFDVNSGLPVRAHTLKDVTYIRAIIASNDGMIFAGTYNGHMIAYKPAAITFEDIVHSFSNQQKDGC